MRALARLTAAAVVTCLLVALSDGASGSVQGPYQVTAGSLVQQGQDLVWKVQLGQSFTAGSLKRAHRSLCLLIGGKRNKTTVCLVPGHRPGHPRLLSTRGSSGVAQAVAASISQRGRKLSASFEPTSLGLPYKAIRWQVQSAAPCATSGQVCSSSFPSAPTVLKLHKPRLVGCEARGPSLVHSGSPDAREVALTFDDGPWDQPPASAFLQVLEREHAVATFFEIGRQIPDYDSSGVYERRMLADGDMIGDHTWSHPDMARVPASEQRSQLLQAADAIRHATRGFMPCLWRPPYGDVSPELVSLARSLGFITVLWDIDPRDWALPGVNAIYNNVVDNAHNGAIVIQHFGGGPRYQTLQALPHEIETLRHRGYKLVTVAQLLGLRLIYK